MPFQVAASQGLAAPAAWIDGEFDLKPRPRIFTDELAALAKTMGRTAKRRAASDGARPFDTAMAR